MTRTEPRCRRHGVPLDLCMDGHYRCQHCVGDWVLAQLAREVPHGGV